MFIFEHDEERQRMFFEDMRKGSPRAQRAHRFANSIMAMMCDFLPRDRECSRHIHEYLLEVGHFGNFEILNVPPEKDALDKLQLERAMLEPVTLFQEPKP